MGTHQRKSRALYLPWQPPIAACWPVETHLNCSHNELHGLVDRHLCAVPLMEPAGHTLLEKGFKLLRSLIRGRPHVMQKKEVINHYVGKKRTVYQNAALSLQQTPLETRDVRVESFVKAEKWNLFMKGHKAPRMIQARSPRFNLAIAKYHKPVEDLIYRTRTTAKLFGSGMGKLRIFAKCRNWEQRASDIEAIWKKFREPLVISVDCKTFDAHVNVEQLRLCHRFYSTIQLSQIYRRLLAMTRHNRGRSSTGVRYECEGRRMSGDIDTACGNSSIMAAIVFGIMHGLVARWCLYDDGDDCLIFIEQSDRHLVMPRLKQGFLTVGHELEIEHTATQFREIVFCQMRPTWLHGRWTLTPSLDKTLSGCFATQHIFPRPDIQAQHLRCQAQSLLSMTRFMPVLNEYAAHVLRCLGPGKMIETFDITNEMAFKGPRNWRVVGASTPSAEDAVEWERTWGVPPSVQEQYLRSLKLCASENIPLKQAEKQRITKYEEGRPYHDTEWLGDPAVTEFGMHKLEVK